MNQEERDARRKAVGEAATEALANRGIIEFNASPELIRAIYSLANEKKMFVGELLRQIVSEAVGDDYIS